MTAATATQVQSASKEKKQDDFFLIFKRLLGYMLHAENPAKFYAAVFVRFLPSPRCCPRPD